jgi:lipoprotein-releasing system permease protein
MPGENMQDWQQTVKVAESNPHVKGAAPYVEGQAMLLARRSSGAIIRGIEPDQEPKVSELGSHMVEGTLADLTPNSWNIVLGKELALTLGVNVGDKVIMVVPEFRGTPMGSVPRQRAFKISGIFELGMQEFDSGLALVNMTCSMPILWRRNWLESSDRRIGLKPGCRATQISSRPSRWRRK